MISLTTFQRMGRSGGSELLYVEIKFGWDVVDYTNYKSASAAVYAFQAFVINTFYSYFVGMHDCLVSALGNLNSGNMSVVVVREIYHTSSDKLH
jgi:hypothetical protein